MQGYRGFWRGPNTACDLCGGHNPDDSDPRAALAQANSGGNGTTTPVCSHCVWKGRACRHPYTADEEPEAWRAKVCVLGHTTRPKTPNRSSPVQEARRSRNVQTSCALDLLSPPQTQGGRYAPIPTVSTRTFAQGHSKAGLLSPPALHPPRLPTFPGG